MRRRKTAQTKILDLLVARHLEDPTSESWGLEIAQATGVSTATTYPILRRFERAEWVLSRDVPAVGPTAPPRTYFRINPDRLGGIRIELAARNASRRTSRIRSWLRPAPKSA